jgi:hypothetical protein
MSNLRRWIMEITLKINETELGYLIMGFPCPHPDYDRSTMGFEYPEYMKDIIDTRERQSRPCSKWKHREIQALSPTEKAKVFYWLRDYAKTC